MTRRVSIVITSYNYEDFLREAVDSALAQDHEAVEVILVDDGSTDSSPAIIRSYGDRVHALFQDNSGQAAAFNAGFAVASGEIVIFLDADDRLEPHAARTVASVWSDECAKTQFRLSLINRAGERTGADPPVHVRLPEGDVVPLLADTGTYTTPVTSGNAFNSRALAALLPIPVRDFHNNADGYVNLLSPFLGPVIAVQEELGCYRLHGNNMWALSGEVTLAALRARIEHDLVRERYLLEFAARAGRAIPVGVMLRNGDHVLHRLASLRLDREHHPLPNDRVGALARAGVRAVLRDPSLTPPDRSVQVAVLAAVAVLPRAGAWAAVRWAMAAKPRPRWLRLLARGARGLAARLRRRPPRGTDVSPGPGLRPR